MTYCRLVAHVTHYHKGLITGCGRPSRTVKHRSINWDQVNCKHCMKTRKLWKAP